MSFSRCRFPGTLNTFRNINPSISRSYVSFAHPINKLNTLHQYNNKTVLIATASRSSHQDGHRRNFGDDFGQIPRPKKINPLPVYLIIAGGAYLSFYLYTKEPCFRKLEIRADAGSEHDRSQVIYSRSPIVPDYVISPLWRRVVAFLIDNTLISVLFQAVHYAFAGQYETLAVPLAVFGSFAYEVLSYIYADGKTLGKYLTNIQVVTDNGTPVTLGVAVKYTLGKLLNIFLMADALYGAFDVSGDKKCIHNVFSRTVVVQAVPSVTKSTTTVTTRH
jgi:uncharacterized RDD family membrane protein YckC